ncbi:hypothetical protein Halru_2188 [Halovivax ruber XH-70]|uniref:Aspartate kinase n=1 Tax=Halovivax ruber (strain DSM 18193 / JCM 13892 / XH-70) TaxID=797302 RepID=L0IB28_HALRX|nr:DUF6293 family protein [Halovivax ruber]AGB16775.1 hypothetical protein Halru_2188 [Halovivax ruber XH-70]
MQTHIVPVGFDYDRLIAPLVRDQRDVDRVVMLEGAVGSQANVEYSRNLARKLETDFENLLGATTERVVLADVYDYDGAFEQGYELITDELDRGNEVWVNVAAMPRTVSFAFANAAHSLMVEREADRDVIHTYYTAPEKYLETELAEELRAQRDLLDDLTTSLEGDDAETAVREEEWIDADASVDTDSQSVETGATDDRDRTSGADTPSTRIEIDPSRLQERLDSAKELLAEFDERGTTIGAKEIGDSHVVELPVGSFSPVKPFEELILFKLGEDGEFDSVSELAEALARELNEEYTDSFRSKVIYTVDRLGPGGKGYVERDEHGKSYRTRLSTIGELWVRTHANQDLS